MKLRHLKTQGIMAGIRIIRQISMAVIVLIIVLGTGSPAARAAWGCGAYRSDGANIRVWGLVTEPIARAYLVTACKAQNSGPMQCVIESFYCQDEVNIVQDALKIWPQKKNGQLINCSAAAGFTQWNDHAGCRNDP